MKNLKAIAVCLFASLIMLAAPIASTESWAQRQAPAQRLASAEGTDQQRADCADDARAVCGRFIPDVSRITQCMSANRTQLSPQCRRHFR